MSRVEDFKQFYKNSLEVKDIDPNIWMANYLVDRLEFNEDQILWFCFLNSITYHLPTAYLLFNEYPDLELVDYDRLSNWWLTAQKDCPFQTDKLKQRKFLPESVLSYQNLVKGKGQKQFFDDILNKTANENFHILWDSLYLNISHFGRFSVWNWAQMLKQVANYQIEPDILFLGDSNAESITHGMCRALNKDEWVYKRRYEEDGKKKKEVHKFSDKEKQFLEIKTLKIMKDLNQEGIEVDAFNIETVACAYKKLFRERDSRYVGYYLDRQAEDIKSIESKGWIGVDWSILWDARRELLNKDMNNNSVNKSKFKLPYEKKLNKIKTCSEMKWFN